MKQPCDICRGSRTIRLPIYRPVPVVFAASAAVKIEETSRVFACPECGDNVDQERVAVLDTHVMVDSHIDDPGFQDHARRAAAHRLVDHLLSGDYITFERGRTDDRNMSYPVVATLGVVSKGKIATLEARIAERQDQLATVAAEEAIRQIDNWGSQSRYTGPDISKRRAAEFIREAVKRVSATWSKAARVDGQHTR